MVELRPFKPEDLDALYAISLATGLSGGDASHLYEDKKLIGHIYSAPYALLDPELALVVADGEGVGGFIVGTHDTEAWEERLEREWWPGLRGHYGPVDGSESSTFTQDQRRIAMIFRPERTPGEVIRTYPAHLHMNILPRLQRQGLGSKLLHAWLDAVSRRGVDAVHIGVNRANDNAIRFWDKQFFVEIAVEHSAPRTLWMGRRR